MDTSPQAVASLPDTPAAAGAHAGRSALRASALLGVLGVVYGDIGTSPLYALKASLDHFNLGNAGVTTPETLGVLSLVFWSLVLIVTVKYVALVMRADNNGEGGILALMALAQRVARSSRARVILGLVGVAGAGLLFGDGVITPAISVLSAVEGLEVVSPAFKDLVLPLSVLVIAGLFAVQSRGTGAVGRMFGPVMALWFLAIAAARAARGRAQPERAGRALAALRGRAVHGARLARLRDARLGRAGGHGRGGALRRHGPFRRPPHPRGLEPLCAALPRAQLFRPGRARDREPRRAVEPILPAVPRLDAAADGGAGDGGDGDREPGADLRRLQHCQSEHLDALAAAIAGSPHERDGGRADLRAAGEHGAARGRPRPRPRVPQQRCLGGGLRHRGHGHVPLYLRAGRRRVPPRVSLAAGSRDRGFRLLLPRGRHLLRR